MAASADITGREGRSSGRIAENIRHARETGRNSCGLTAVVFFAMELAAPQRLKRIFTNSAAMRGLAKLYATCGSRREAERIARRLLGKGLVACANIFPVKSLYWWNGRIAQSGEHVLLCTTGKSLAARAEKAILDLHSYEVPCVLVLPAEGTVGYARWVQEETDASRHKKR